MPPKPKAKRTKTDETKLLKEYKIDKMTHIRRAALIHDVQTHGPEPVIRKLTNVRDINEWNPRAHDIYTKDLVFLQKIYK